MEMTLTRAVRVKKREPNHKVADHKTKTMSRETLKCSVELRGTIVNT